MAQGKTIMLFPEAAFGPALNCVGIAQELKERGHNPVFVADASFLGVFAKYGFPEHLVNMSAPMDAAAASQFWKNFIASHLPHFRLSALDQIETYVVPTWEAIADSAIYAEPGLRRLLAEIRPDVICIDNVILFPAIKRYGAPWIRIISCSENEIPDPDIPPHLSGCGESERACFAAYQRRFEKAIKPAHDRFLKFLAECGEEPYPLGEFFETSPFMNLMLYPRPLRFKRRHPLDPERFHYLEGCVRREESYIVPHFAMNRDKPLVYLSYGSLGAADVELIKRQIALLARLPYRALVNVGDYLDQYGEVPGNVHIAAWFPQPSVIPQVDAVIHHGGNNTFTEALYFARPALIMPYCWDGHDNAQRIQDTGFGLRLPRYEWTDEEFAAALDRLVSDQAMRARLEQASAGMQRANGVGTAADLILAVAGA